MVILLSLLNLWIFLDFKGSTIKERQWKPKRRKGKRKERGKEKEKMEKRGKGIKGKRKAERKKGETPYFIFPANPLCLTVLSESNVCCHQCIVTTADSVLFRRSQTQ